MTRFSKLGRYFFFSASFQTCAITIKLDDTPNGSIKV